jgi:uncharacterized repeat protein (TIGR01451 family)
VVQGTIAANANKINSVTFTPTNNPVVGGTLKISVFGDTGGVGSGAILDFTGASWTNWNAGAFQLVACSITVTNGSNPSFNQYLTNTLTAAANSHFTGNGNLYEADYWFRAVATTGTNTTPVSAISYIQSGGQTKHTSLGAGQLPAALPATNLTTLNSLVNSTQLYTNQTVSFALVVSNLSAAYSVTLDRFVDTLPAGFVYVPNSSTFGGAPILEPTNAGGVLTWSQGNTYIVPAGARSDFVFQAIVPGVASPTYFTNSCAGYVQNFQIGTTLANNAPATETVRALIAPIAGSVTNTTALENQTLTVSAPGVLANTVEPNGFTPSVISNSQPANGSATVNTDGSYTYMPAPFFWGWDSFTFTLTNGNSRVSTGTNYVYVNPVNQPPTLNAIGNLNLVENWNLQTVALAGITAGPANESSQTLTVSATSSNPSLIPNPTVNYSSPNSTGSLTFTPVTNKFGQATITVIVHDNGGTANGGVDSLTNTFVVTETGITNYWLANSNLTVNVFDATGGAGSGYSRTNYTGVLSVLATAANPFTIKLASFNGGSPGLAANFNYASNYTWTIATTTRGVIGFATNDFVVDTSAFTNDLAGGYFTVALSPDGNSVELVFVSNYPPPTADPVPLTRALNTSLKISIANILTNYTADLNGDARVLMRADAGTNGSTIYTNGGYIFYAPTNNLSESFIYVVTDARAYRPGDTVLMATNWITIAVTHAQGAPQSLSTSGGGPVAVKFAGVPGYGYDVLRSTDLSAWSVVFTTNAPPNGIWIYSDDNPPQPSAFYRTQQH